MIQGMSVFALPDLILREDEMKHALPHLAGQLGYAGAAAPETAAPDQPIALSEIYDDEIETIVSEVYQRDYMMFGFKPWG